MVRMWQILCHGLSRQDCRRVPVRGAFDIGINWFIIALCVVWLRGWWWSSSYAYWLIEIVDVNFFVTQLNSSLQLTDTGITCTLLKELLFQGPVEAIAFSPPPLNECPLLLLSSRDDHMLHCYKLPQLVDVPINMNAIGNPYIFCASSCSHCSICFRRRLCQLYGHGCVVQPQRQIPSRINWQGCVIN